MSENEGKPLDPVDALRREAMTVARRDDAALDDWGFTDGALILCGIAGFFVGIFMVLGGNAAAGVAVIASGIAALAAGIALRYLRDLRTALHRLEALLARALLRDEEPPTSMPGKQ